MVMSGVDDGLLLSFSTENGDGLPEPEAWVIRMGRRDDNDICLRNDTFSSRYHARLHWKSDGWWLEDCESKNGTFVENQDDDARVSGTIPVEIGQLFRVGRTWLRIQETE
jgi:pSer/pThr/pTyr-binding forkhead associated (FHA) protein